MEWLKTEEVKIMPNGAKRGLMLKRRQYRNPVISADEIIEANTQN